MTLDILIANKALIGLCVFASLFALERLNAAEPVRANPQRLFRNGALWLLLALLSPLIVLPLSAFVVDRALWRRPADWPALAQLFVDLLLLDCWAYWLHRAYHESPIMRRLHLVHHLDERLDTTSAVRFHPGEVVLSAILRMAPLIFFAIPFVHVVIFETLLLAATFFHHSNVRLPRQFEGLMSAIVVTPSIHWVHHHRTPADTNSNYAAIFSVWDGLFGTHSKTQRYPGMSVGLGDLADKTLPGLLLAPFRPQERS
jgi:sterol desaturase/sphingolipid hydroxylase (fatty acid hydroxylase superfamily)